MKLSFNTIGYGKRPILKNLEFSFETGTIIGVVAPNGMGKTTLFNGIMNQTSLLDGTLTFNGHEYHYPLSTKEEVKLYQNISMMVNSDDLIPYISGSEHLTFAKQNWNSNKNIDDVVNLLDMGSYVKDKVSTYSLGMRQRLCFAMQLVMDTPVMLMDEVMNSLDIVNVDLISKELVRLKEENKTILITSHLLDNLSLYADQVLFIKNVDDFYLFSGQSTDQVLTIHGRTRDQVLQLFDGYPLREPFDNKFQIDASDLPHEFIVELLGADSIRQITIGDKTIVDYYHDLYL